MDGGKKKGRKKYEWRKVRRRKEENMNGGKKMERKYKWRKVRRRKERKYEWM